MDTNFFIKSTWNTHMCMCMGTHVHRHYHVHLLMHAHEHTWTHTCMAIHTHLSFNCFLLVHVSECLFNLYLHDGWLIGLKVFSLILILIYLWFIKLVGAFTTGCLCVALGSWNFLCRPEWPHQRSICLCLPRIRIRGFIFICLHFWA